jgi:hypothetical protein
MSWKPYSAFRRVSIKIRTVTSRGGGGGEAGVGGRGEGVGGGTEDFRLISIFSSFSKACAWEEGRKIPHRHAGRTGSKARMEAGG